jgi:hypothetical protein
MTPITKAWSFLVDIAIAWLIQHGLRFFGSGEAPSTFNPSWISVALSATINTVS